MPVWLQIIAANALLCLMVYARALYLELKATKSQLKNAEEIIKALKEELQDTR